MSTDWFAEVSDAGVAAKKAAAEIPRHLGNPDMTADEAGSLYEVVERGAQASDALLSGMIEEDAEENLIEAADLFPSWTHHHSTARDT